MNREDVHLPPNFMFSDAWDNPLTIFICCLDEWNLFVCRQAIVKGATKFNLHVCSLHHFPLIVYVESVQSIALISYCTRISMTELLFVHRFQLQQVLRYILRPFNGFCSMGLAGANLSQQVCCLFFHNQNIDIKWFENLCPTNIWYIYTFNHLRGWVYRNLSQIYTFTDSDKNWYFQVCEFFHQVWANIYKCLSSYISSNVSYFSLLSKNCYTIPSENNHCTCWTGIEFDGIQ
jgi:hypothetical protein